MTKDYQAELLDPIFDELGVDATIDRNGYPPISVTVLDKTSGQEIDEGGMGILTTRPVASVRSAELNSNSLTMEDLEGSFITFNGRTWRVTGKYARPTPQGYDVAQIWLVLTRHDHE